MSEKILKLYQNKYVKDILIMIFLGSLSGLFGTVKFHVPGLEGASSDLREIPLLIGIFHVSNPLYAVGMSLLSNISVSEGIPYFSSFMAHTAALVIWWYVFSYFKRFKTKVIISGLIWFVLVSLYFLFLLIPFLILFHRLYGLYTDNDFFYYFKSFIYSTRFEMLSTSMVIMFYAIQDKIRYELKKHKDGLETLVKNRTKDLEKANEELRVLNNDMYGKSITIKDQNEELQTTLRSLKETQANLIQVEKMASLGVLTAGVAHEINNPLNYIMGGCEGLKQYFAENESNDEEHVSTMLNAIETGVERAGDIVKGLNQFSRDNEEKDEDCDIHAIIDNCLVIIHSQIKEDIIIEKKYDPDVPQVKGNVGKLHQVFMNVITNANQAIEGHGKIVINTRKNKEGIIVEVSDTGLGMDEEILSKITDPFFTTKEPGKGTGLGLTIAYSIIKDHGGKMEFISDPGKGTVVRIMLLKTIT